jgi:hypothetical protein
MMLLITIGLDSSTRDVVTNEPQDLLVEDSSKNASNMDTIFSPVLDDELYSETDRGIFSYSFIFLFKLSF